MSGRPGAIRGNIRAAMTVPYSMWRCTACVALALTLAGCKRAPSDRERPVLSSAPRPMLAANVELRERAGRGRLTYLGLDATPARPERGQLVRVVHYFRVEEPCSGDYEVFLHAEAPGGQQVITDDHPPAAGRFPTSTWRAGEIWRDEDSVQVPAELSAGPLTLYAGLFAGDSRLTVVGPAGASDGKDRVRVGELPISGLEGTTGAPAGDLPEVTIARASARITCDGVLDEEVWAKAEVLTFADTMGRGIETHFPTKLRILWDDENLYVAFESIDPDITDPFSKRDDPIYDHEAVELFLMPNVVAPALGPYVELQASPSGVIFDAAFTGRRQGMDRSFDAGQVVATVIDGTLNQRGDRDRGWVSEWIVPFRGLRGVEHAPKAGDEWRMNAFRLEKNGEGRDEYTAWSPPKIGDFHNIVRFGRMRFAGP